MRHPANERQRPTPSYDVAALLRHEAENDSRDCPYCFGAGLAMIYHPGYNGSRVLDYRKADGSIQQIPAIAAAYCVCPMGDWTRYHQDKTCHDVFRRMPELHDVLQRRISWVAKDPSFNHKLLELEDMSEFPGWRAIYAALHSESGSPPGIVHAKPVRAPRYEGIPHDSVLSCDRQSEPGENG